MTPRIHGMTLLGLLGAGYFSAWSGWPLHLPTSCPFKLVTGMPCGACGLTHAFCALAHAELAQAVDFNIAVVPLACATVVATALAAYQVASNRPLVMPAWKATRRPIVWAGVAVFAVGWTVNLAKYWGW